MLLPEWGLALTRVGTPWPKLPSGKALIRTAETLIGLAKSIGMVETLIRSAETLLALANLGGGMWDSKAEEGRIRFSTKGKGQVGCWEGRGEVGSGRRRNCPEGAGREWSGSERTGEGWLVSMSALTAEHRGMQAHCGCHSGSSPILAPLT
jgi:hypothetical protein